MRNALIRQLERFEALDCYFWMRRRTRRRCTIIISAMQLSKAKWHFGHPEAGYRRVFVGRQWLVGKCVDSVVSEDVRDATFRWVTSRLDAAGIDYFVVPARCLDGTSVGVCESFREGALRAFTTPESDPHRYFRVGTARWQPLHSGADPRRHNAVNAQWITICEIFGSASGAGAFGPEHACEVQFWSHDSQSEYLRAPRSNPVGTSGTFQHLRDMDVAVGGGRHRTAIEFSWFFSNRESRFPIDIVYTWVDGADKAWQGRRAGVQPLVERSSYDAAVPQRFRSFDELRYSLRSVYQYVPFVRNIFIVTDDQHPEFLSPGSRISIVDHKEIFSDQSSLPTFNSHAIETQLHNIPGLAENYLYMNDDVFFGRLTDRATYFDQSGHTKFFESLAGFGLGRPSDEANSVDHAGKNLQLLLQKDSNQVPFRKIKHSPHPQQKSLHLIMEDRFPEVHHETMNSRFRSRSDVSFAAALHHRFGQSLGRASPGMLDYEYIDLADRNLEDKLENLKRASFEILCLNDGDIHDDAVGSVKKQVRRFLEYRFPYRAPWESD